MPQVNHLTLVGVQKNPKKNNILKRRMTSAPYSSCHPLATPQADFAFTTMSGECEEGWIGEGGWLKKIKFKMESVGRRLVEGNGPLGAQRARNTRQNQQPDGISIIIPINIITAGDFVKFCRECGRKRERECGEGGGRPRERQV